MEGGARLSSQDDNCGGAGTAGGPIAGITGGLVGADFGPGGCAIRLRLVPGRLLASAGRNRFGRFRWRFAGGTFWAQCDGLRIRRVWHWPVVGSPATRATGKSFAAITLSIVLLVARAEPAWVVALHRFLEVSAGIVAGLLLSAVWPEQQTGHARSAIASITRNV